VIYFLSWKIHEFFLLKFSKIRRLHSTKNVVKNSDGQENPLTFKHDHIDHLKTKLTYLLNY